MKKNKNIIIRIDKSLKDRLKEHCRINNTTISKLINDYLEDLVEPMIYEMSLVYDQLKSTNPISKENIMYFNKKNFYSGRKKNIGDKILFGFLIGENKYDLIDFHFDEIDEIYSLKNDETNPTKFPYLKLKK